jgi:uncharacterized repeat protein (TIGR01451 family)
LDNTASITSDTADLVPGNNSATKTINVNDGVDLAVTLHASLSKVQVGNPLRYTLNVSNSGTGTAQSVSAVVTLPAGAVYVGASGTGWTCGYNSGQVTCTRTQLATGAAPVVQIDIRAPYVTPSITAHAVVSFSGTDSNAANNTVDEVTLTEYVIFLPIIQN